MLRVCGHAHFAALIYRGHDEPPRTQDAIDRLPKDDRRLIQSLVDRLVFLTSKSPAGAGDDAPKGGAR